jgi:hypothetical protein
MAFATAVQFTYRRTNDASTETNEDRTEAGYFGDHRGVYGVRGVERATVWLYGEVLWVHTQHFDYEAERRGRTKQVQIITSPLVKRYRDGEGSMFLIEIPRTMAEVLKLEDFVLAAEEVERFKGRIDTTRQW